MATKTESKFPVFLAVQKWVPTTGAWAWRPGNEVRVYAHIACVTILMSTSTIFAGCKTLLIGIWVIQSTIVVYCFSLASC